ncbi:MAG: VCBS repeat-containing protein [Candidatus Zixiibacteriota bacterium]|nr:MAG: VCBS repeat-containing protein [candidate division Zixibacteria bacterium]
MKNCIKAAIISAICFAMTVRASGVLFESPVTFITGQEPHSVYAADFDGNGYPDLAIANNNSDDVSVHLNSGDGTFLAPVSYAAQDEPYSVFSADFNGDDLPDLAVANRLSQSVSVLLNTGEGTFGASANYGTGGQAVSVSSADFDNDGDYDLVAANLFSNKVAILTNDGTGVFSAPIPYAVAIAPRCVFSADLNEDGHVDLAVTNENSDNVSILLNKGDGTFFASVNYPSGPDPISIFAEDLNGDGYLDLAVVNYAPEPSFGSTTILFNDGDGTFSYGAKYTAGSGARCVYAADLDDDGDGDLVVANRFTDDLSLFLNNGDGSFNPAISYAAGEGPFSVFAIDLDDDMDLDLAVGNSYSNDVSVFSNRSSAAQPALVAHWSFDDGTATDITGNGHDGTIVGTPAFVPGVCGAGLAPELNGAGDYIEVPDSNPLDLGHEITIAMWVRRVYESSSSILIAKTDGGIWNYRIKAGGYDIDNISFEYTSAVGEHSFLVEDAGLDDADWHFIGVSYRFGDPESMLYMIDDQVRTGHWFAGDGSELPLLHDKPLRMGAQYRPGFEGFYTGVLDEVRLYGCALSGADLIALYDEFNCPPQELCEDTVLWDDFTGTDIDWTKWNLHDSHTCEPHGTISQDDELIIELPETNNNCGSLGLTSIVDFDDYFGDISCEVDFHTTLLCNWQDHPLNYSTPFGAFCYKNYLTRWMVIWIDATGQEQRYVFAVEPITERMYHLKVEVAGGVLKFWRGVDDGEYELVHSVAPGQFRHMPMTNIHITQSDRGLGYFDNVMVTVPAPCLPVAICQDITLEAGHDCTATGSIDNGSYAWDGGTVTLTQNPPGPYSIGETEVTLTATDDNGSSSTCTATVTVTGGLGSISGHVNVITAAGLTNVPVDLFDAGGNHLASTATDETGAYEFGDLLSEKDYTVSIVTPLGYSVDEDAVIAHVNCGQASTVNFDLTRLEVPTELRGLGYWVHQVNSLLKGKDTHESWDDMCQYMELIRIHFNLHGLNPVSVFEVDLESDCQQRLEALRATISPTVPSTMNERARAHLTVLLLNMVSAKIGQWAVISEDGATVSQAITYCNALISDDNPDNDELAKDIAEMINEGMTVPAGMIDLSTPTYVYKTGGVPRDFGLSQNYPNPFNPSTDISFGLPHASQVKLEVFNIMGQRITTLVNRQMEAGHHTVSFDGTKMASGIYLYRIQAGDFVESRKMILIK